jgi:hypothetical protein
VLHSSVLDAEHVATLIEVMPAQRLVLLREPTRQLADNKRQDVLPRLVRNAGGLSFRTSMR